MALSAAHDGSVKLWSLVAMAVWLGGFHINLLVAALCISQLPSLWAIALLAIWATLVFLPAEYETPLGSSVAKFIVRHATKYFPIKVIFEDEKAFNPDQSYVIAAEPHSVFPLGIVVLTPQSGVLPVKKLRALATSAVFWTPGVRHIWTWLGVAPVSKKSFTQFLQKGISCIVVPGGVQECLYLEKGREVVFLKKRFGFIKIAIETGSPLVPTYCFGQSNTYKWWKPKGKWYDQISRRIGFTPLIFWGRFGGPVPFRSPMHYVVGKPIAVTRNTNPSHDEVAVVHKQFIDALEALFEKYKKDLGLENTSLEVY